MSPCNQQKICTLFNRNINNIFMIVKFLFGPENLNSLILRKSMPSKLKVEEKWFHHPRSSSPAPSSTWRTTKCRRSRSPGRWRRRRRLRWRRRLPLKFQFLGFLWKRVLAKIRGLSSSSGSALQGLVLLLLQPAGGYWHEFLKGRLMCIAGATNSSGLWSSSWSALFVFPPTSGRSSSATGWEHSPERHGTEFQDVLLNQFRCLPGLVCFWDWLDQSFWDLNYVIWTAEYVNSCPPPCPRGHTMCARCRGRLWRCPLCRADLFSMPPIRWLQNEFALFWWLKHLSLAQEPSAREPLKFALTEVLTGLDLSINIQTEILTIAQQMCRFWLPSNWNWRIKC